MRASLFSVVLLLMLSTLRAQKADNSDEVSVLTWNILVPIRVNMTSLNETGAVDMNLLDAKIRQRLIIHRILGTDADIVNLQEVQIDTYDAIKEFISDVYEAVPFAPHEPEHWADLNQEPIANGGATFYKRNAFVAFSSERFLTHKNGNAALGTVLRRTYNSDSLTGPPIVLVNCHLQWGFGLDRTLLRVSQGNSVIKWASEMTKSLRSKFPSEEPVIILTGDFNTITGYPGLENIKGNGYTDAREITNITDFTVHFPELMITNLLPPLSGLSIDTFLVPDSDVKTGRIQFKSHSIPDLRSHELNEYNYVKKVMKIFLDDLKQGKLGKQEVVRVLLKLHDTITDGENYDTLYNRAMRLGSDHLPVVVVLTIRKE